MNIDSLLADFGLNKNQSAVYTTLLQMGSGNIQDVAKKAGIKRTTAYSVLDALIEREMASVVSKDGHRLYTVEDPRKLPDVLNLLKQEVENKQKQVKTMLPQLISLYNPGGLKPSIRYYEGVEGIKKVMDETLETDPKRETIAYSTASDIHKYLGSDWVYGYLDRRAKAGIHQRAIIEDSAIGRKHKLNDAKELRQTILVPPHEYQFNLQYGVYGDKVMLISFKDLFGVVIESKAVAETQRAIFELAWIGAKHITGQH